MLFLLSIQSQAAVSSIDLGSDWLKVAVVNLKLGQSRISIAINEISKRKSPALVAFQSGTQLLGEEAAGIVTHYPDKVYSQLRGTWLENHINMSRYGIDKDFSNESGHVIFYNMGSSSKYAALVYYSAYNAKEFGKTVSVNQFQVKYVRWDSELGGQNMELRLVQYFADEFNKQLGNGVDVKKSPKAMAKLKKQVKRTKEILSANTIFIESFYDDRDFSTITLELIGGATRVPKLQVKLQEFLGRKELDKHLDADEAIVLGAALHAAYLSDGIKLNHKLGMTDGSSYGFIIELDGPDLSKNDSNKQLLVPRKKNSQMFRTIIHNKDFGVSLAYESDDLLPPGLLYPVFAQYVVSGLAEASEKYSSHNLSAPIKTNLHFSLSRSGIISLDRADAVIEISEWVEVPRKNTSVENATTASSNISAEVGAEKASEENKEGLNSDSVVSSASNTNTNTNTTAEEPSTVDLGTEKRLTKKTFRVSLKIVEKTAGPGMSLLKESLVEAKGKLEALDKKDAERRKTAEFKNNLESYIYPTKEKLGSEEFEKISSVDEHQSFMEKLDEVQEWLYTNGEEATAKEFQERLDSLTAIGDPVAFWSELTERPTAVEYSQRYLGQLQQVIQGWEENRPWLPKERVDELLGNEDKFKTWLKEKETEQTKTSAFSTPAFTSEEVYRKLLDLQTKVDSINKIPKPKPKIENPVKNKTASGGENVKDSNSTSENTSQGDKPATESDAPPDEKVEAEGKNHDEL
ncbi:hypothetical protein SLA2020_376090 [Shorea laevis]